MILTSKFELKIWLICVRLNAINLKWMIVDRTSNGFEILDDLRRDRVTLHGHVPVGRNARAITQSGGGGRILSSGDRKHSTIREELSPLEICRASVSCPRVRAANPSRCSRWQDFARKHNHASVTARDRLTARDVHAHRSRDAIAANAIKFANFSLSLEFSNCYLLFYSLSCDRANRLDRRDSPFLEEGSSTGATYSVRCGCSWRNSRLSEDSEDSRWAASPDRPPSSRCRPRRRSCLPSGLYLLVVPEWPLARRWVARESPDGMQIDVKLDSRLESKVPWGWYRLWAAVVVLQTVIILCRRSLAVDYARRSSMEMMTSFLWLTILRYSSCKAWLTILQLMNINWSLIN